jgi:hypothetical protein
VQQRIDRLGHRGELITDRADQFVGAAVVSPACVIMAPSVRI